MKEEKLLKNQNGITLIALVITIIVMLILAGVTINLTLGDNGIFTTAQQAAKNYTDAQNKEMAEMEDFTSTVDKAVESIQNNYEIAGTVIKTENNVKYTADGAGKFIPVPVGFSPITTPDQGTEKTGFVIKNNTDGNEFVWIPVGNVENYKRVAWTRDNWYYRQTLDTTTGKITRNDLDAETYYWTETMPQNEYDSVSTYRGFYIARYEAGIVGGTKGDTRVDGTYYTGNSMKLVIQKDQQVWNWITKGRAKTESESLYNKTTDNVTSKLCSSYAWDTTLKFIETNNNTYPTSSEGDNHTGALKETGYNKVNNIYDMGGNASEWNTESQKYSDTPNVIRGGSYRATDPAASRGRDGTAAYNTLSFRVTLFL